MRSTWVVRAIVTDGRRADISACPALPLLATVAPLYILYAVGRHRRDAVERHRPDGVSRHPLNSKVLAAWREVLARLAHQPHRAIALHPPSHNRSHHLAFQAVLHNRINPLRRDWWQSDFTTWQSHCAAWPKHLAQSLCGEFIRYLDDYSLVAQSLGHCAVFKKFYQWDHLLVWPLARIM
jgi:hypothetical protein